MFLLVGYVEFDLYNLNLNTITNKMNKSNFFHMDFHKIINYDIGCSIFISILLLYLIKLSLIDLGIKEIKQLFT